MALRAGELLIDDGNWHMHIPADPDVNGRGLIPRDYGRTPHGSMPYAGAFDLPEIPERDWSAMIREGEADKSFLSHVRDTGLNGGPIPSLDQDGTNYCWSHGPTSAMLLVRAANNLPYVRLSATAVAAQIKNYRNEGGWGGEALEWIVSKGIPSVEFWPPNARESRYVTAEMKANAELHRVTEWYDLQPRNFNQLMTCVLLRIPVAVGYNWWSHEVCAVDPVEISPGKFGIRIWNSWADSYGLNGMAVLDRNKATPDDAVAPRVINASIV